VRVPAGVLRGAGYPARVAGTRICGAGAGTRTALRAGVGLLRGGRGLYLLRVRGGRGM